jgi:hypothetical protein
MGGLSWDGKKHQPRPWNSQTADTFRATVWTATTAVAYTMWGNPATYIMDDPLAKLGDLNTPRALKVLAKVMAGLPYWKMAPANDVVSPGAVTIDDVEYRTNFALAKAGAAYLVYASRGGTVKIELAKGNYTARAVDPRTGEARDLGRAAGGTFATELAFGTDTVLVIKAMR